MPHATADSNHKTAIQRSAAFQSETRQAQQQLQQHDYEKQPKNTGRNATSSLTQPQPGENPLRALSRTQPVSHVLCPASCVLWPVYPVSCVLSPCRPGYATCRFVCLFVFRVRFLPYFQCGPFLCTFLSLTRNPTRIYTEKGVLFPATALARALSLSLYLMRLLSLSLSFSLSLLLSLLRSVPVSRFPPLNVLPIGPATRGAPFQLDSNADLLE